MSNKTVIGVVGCGGFCRGNHIPNLLANPAVELKTLCDLKPDGLKEYGVKEITTDMEKVFADPEIEGVVCGTKPDARMDIMKLAKKYRKPLFVVCGRSTVPYKVWHKSGITDVYTLQEVEPDPSKCYQGTRRLLAAEGIRIAGCDEAGRGCLAGPVFAAAVILPDGFYHPLLNDSKQMSERERNELREIIEREAVAWSVVAVDAAEIDRINILNASISGMQRALDGLAVRPNQILVDGNRFRSYTGPDGVRIPFHCLVHGDARAAAIAAASVLAKTHRDEYMQKLAGEYPQYGWERNMAYPTAEHREAIRRYGITPYHRRSYKLD